jgi:hypothetical protein
LAWKDLFYACFFFFSVENLVLIFEIGVVLQTAALESIFILQKFIIVYTLAIEVIQERE